MISAEIYNSLQHSFNEGYEAYKEGLSKYENPNEPGSLNFDSWNAGWHSAQSNEFLTT